MRVSDLAIRSPLFLSGTGKVPGFKRAVLATQSSSSAINRIWITAALLAPAALLNYLDRQMLASMKFSVTHSVLGFTSEQQWGVMLAQFKWVYAFLSPIGGYCADRFSRSKVICLSLFCWSLITYLTGQAHTFHQLMWIRTAMGVSESLYIPAALALIVESGTGKNSSKAVALHTGAIYVGMILGGFSGYAADAPNFGWRAAFHLAGLAGVGYSVVLALGLKDVRSAASQHVTPIPPGASARELFANSSFLLLAVYYTLIAMPAWMMKDWMPGMLKEHFDISQGKAGVSASLYVNLAGFVGLSVGAWFAVCRLAPSECWALFPRWRALVRLLIWPRQFSFWHYSELCLVCTIRTICRYSPSWFGQSSEQRPTG